MQQRSLVGGFGRGALRITATLSPSTYYERLRSREGLCSL